MMIGEHMNPWRDSIRWFYYNIFRFECATQYYIPYPIIWVFRKTRLFKVLGRRNEIDDFEEYLLATLNNPEGGISLHIAGLQISVLMFLLLLSLWNLVSAFLTFAIHSFWLYGLILAGVVSLVISEYVAPSDRKKYLKDFRRFEAMPRNKKRKAAILTLLVVVAIWSTFVATFIFYLSYTD